MPLELQAKLLRVLQEREFQRVGGLKTIHMHARIIAATNRNLETMVQEGAFREDLYFRLKVFVIRIPPLRERPEDIIPLTEYFVHVLNQRDGQENILAFPLLPRRHLKSYDWPGNVRELQNVLRRSMILSKGEILEFNKNWIQKKELLQMGISENASKPDEEEELQSLDEVEKKYIMKGT